MPAYDEQEYTNSFDIKIWKRLGPYLRPRRRAFVLLIVLNLLTALVDAALPLFQRYAVAHFIEAGTLVEKIKSSSQTLKQEYLDTYERGE